MDLSIIRTDSNVKLLNDCVPVDPSGTEEPQTPAIPFPIAVPNNLEFNGYVFSKTENCCLK